jgi:hypothetical protein
MLIQSPAARATCAVAVGAFAAALCEGRSAADDASQPIHRSGVVAFAVPHSARGQVAGLTLESRSERHAQLWRAIEQVASSSSPAGKPCSPTLRRLLEWAQSSRHPLRGADERRGPLRRGLGARARTRCKRSGLAGARCRRPGGTACETGVPGRRGALIEPSPRGTARTPAGGAPPPRRDREACGGRGSCRSPRAGRFRGPRRRYGTQWKPAWHP